MLGYDSSYMFGRSNYRAIFRVIIEQVECTIGNALSIVHSHSLKDHPDNGPTIGLAKHVAGIITSYNLIKYEVVCDCIIYIYIII
jgi:hypothetical protein